jgi:hypothetical protein
LRTLRNVDQRDVSARDDRARLVLDGAAQSRGGGLSEREYRKTKYSDENA